MFKTGKLVGVAVAAVLVLSGCASAGASADVARSAAPEVVASAEPTVEPEAVPVGVEIADADRIFVDAVRGSKAVPEGDDTDLIAYGHAACALVASGVPVQDVDVIAEDVAGEPVPGWTDDNLTGLATQTYCTEYWVG